MAGPRWQDLLARIRRRLEWAIECVPECALELRSLAAQLGRCARWDQLEQWHASLPSMFEAAPLGAYVATALKRREPHATLALPSELPAPRPLRAGHALPVVRLRPRDEPDAFAYGQEALLAWESWQPHLDPDLFRMEFCGDWDGQDSEHPAVDAVARVLAGAEGKALALRYYTREAYLVDVGAFRAAWVETFTCAADDWLVVPLSPEPAAWALCYFHHDVLEVGLRHAPWPHPAP